MMPVFYEGRWINIPLPKLEKAGFDVQSENEKRKKIIIELELDVPEWAKYLAQHENGEWTVYDHKPIANRHSIQGEPGMWRTQKGFEEHIIFSDTWLSSLRDI